jgi:hypothetical protein
LTNNRLSTLDANLDLVLINENRIYDSHLTKVNVIHVSLSFVDYVSLRMFTSLTNASDF